MRDSVFVRPILPVAGLMAVIAAAPANPQTPAGTTVQELMQPPERIRTAPGTADVGPAPLSELGLRNLVALARVYGAVRFFHPTDAATNTDWDSWLIGAVAMAEPSRDIVALRRNFELMLAGVAPTVKIGRSAEASAVALPPPPPGATGAFRWRHKAYSDARDSGRSQARTLQTGIGAADMERIDLGNGLTALVPLAAWRSGSVMPDFTAMIPYLKPVGFVPSGHDRTTRLAGVIKAWATLRHFYPYFDVAAQDWDAQLRPALRSAASDGDDLVFADTLRRLLSGLRDGHGRIVYATVEDGFLPLKWDRIAGQLVITEVGAPAAAQGIGRGDIVEMINGMDALAALDRESQLASGSAQAIDFVARRSLLAGRTGDRAQLRISGRSGSRLVSLTYNKGPAPTSDAPVRPEKVSEIERGIYYLDFSRVSDEDISEVNLDLARAKGIIIDLRGYPRVGIGFLGHMTDQSVRGAQFDWPIFTRPGGQAETYEASAWTIVPATPRWSRNIVILIDVPAVSYSESLLALIQGNRLATLVGEPTAGANGNIGIIRLPGDYRAVFTSMRVRNMDGSQHHLIGIKPDVPVSQTIAAVRSGRDLMFEKALEIVRSRAK